MLSAFRALPTWSRCTTCAKVHRLFFIFCAHSMWRSSERSTKRRSRSENMWKVCLFYSQNNKIEWLSYITADTFWRNLRGAQRYVGFYFLVVLCGCWLAEQTPVTWIVCSSNCAKLPPESVFCLVFNVFYFNGHWIRDNWATCILVNDTWTEQSPVEVDGTSTKLKQIPQSLPHKPWSKIPVVSCAWTRTALLRVTTANFVHSLSVQPKISSQWNREDPVKN